MRSNFENSSTNNVVLENNYVLFDYCNFYYITHFLPIIAKNKLIKTKEQKF